MIDRASAPAVLFLCACGFCFASEPGMPALMTEISPRGATPSPHQELWHDMEIIMFLHISPSTWQGVEQDNLSTPLAQINPAGLDVNQWIDAAEALGARMILFTAKHSGGFCWWQTETSDYSIKNTPYKDGKGDVLLDLSEACWKRGMKLGVYVYPSDKSMGAVLGSGGRVKDPSKQEAYNKVLRKQWEEVLTRYGTVTEIWFDGSCIVPLDDIVGKYAPYTMILQSPMANLRWVGTERGFAPYPAWNSVKRADAETGVSTAAHGDPDGDVWIPLEVNTTLKDHYWFWSPGNEQHLKSIDHLTECYYKSVGRGGVFLLNAAPDTDGVIPAADMRLYRQLGNMIRERFDESIAETKGKGSIVELDLGELTEIDHVIAMEDIAFGERVRRYVIEGDAGEGWFKIVEGRSIGHKRIDKFEPLSVKRIRLHCVESSVPPVIEKLAVYMVGDPKVYDSLQTGRTDGFGNPWDAGMRVYSEPVEIGKVSDFHSEDAGQYVVDLSPYIDEACQYELYVSLEVHGSIQQRIRSVELWLEGTQTPGFCCVHRPFRRMELNIASAPGENRKKDSTVIKFKSQKELGDEKLFMHKVYFK